MGAKNAVIAGDCTEYTLLKVANNIMLIKYKGTFSFKKEDEIILNNDTVEQYEVITDEQRKSAASGIARGAIGATLLGPVGVLAGLSAKNKGVYTIAIKFKDGKNSLIEVDEKIYKQLVKNLF